MHTTRSTSATRTTGLAAAALALVASACGSTTASNADQFVGGQAGAGASPTIDGFDVIATGSGATLIASVNDADGDVTSATIDWGDGSVEQVTAGFPGLRVDHAYTTPGVFAVSLQAVDATGRAISTAGTADLTERAPATSEPPPTTVPPTTAPPTNPPPTTAPPTTTPTTVPPTIAPPTTTPPPQTTTTTTTTAPPPPAPEPIRIDLRNSLIWDIDASAPDAAGGRGEAKKVGTNGAAFRSVAWHGYNGSGSAGAEASIDQDWSGYLNSFQAEYGTTLARVDVSWQVSGRGELKAPWDRAASVSGSVEIGGGLESSSDSTVLIDTSFALGDKVNSPDGVTIDARGFTSLHIDAANSDLFFFLDISCGSSSGGQAFALLNEGWCDFFEGGGVTLDQLDVTLTPLPGYEFANGTVVHAD